MSMHSTITFKPPDKSYFVNIVMSQKWFSEMKARVWLGVTVVLLRALREWLWFCQSVEQLCLHGSDRQAHSANWECLCQKDIGAFQFAKKPPTFCVFVSSRWCWELREEGKYGYHTERMLSTLVQVSFQQMLPPFSPLSFRSLYRMSNIFKTGSENNTKNAVTGEWPAFECLFFFFLKCMFC